MINEPLIYIGALAILDMFSPAIIGVSVYILMKAKAKQATLLLSYLLTVVIFYFCVGLCLMIGLDFIIDPIANIFNHKAAKIFLTVVGGLLFISSWFVPKRSNVGSPKPKKFTVAAMIALGLTTSIFEVATAIPYFAAIGLMISNQFSSFEWLPILIGYNVIMILPALALLFLFILSRRFAQKPLNYLQSLAQKNTSSALSWIMCIAGIIMLVYGTN